MLALGFLSATGVLLMFLANVLMLIVGCHDKPWPRQAIDDLVFGSIALAVTGWLLPDFFKRKN